jgi:hypothetical protein
LCKNKERKRVIAESWTFTIDDYAYKNQIETVKNIKSNEYSYIDEKTKIILQQINKKIYGYKQQDIIKKLLDNDKFITLKSVIDKMIACELKCYYCQCEMNVLYDISREMKQWTVDRIDNDLGHNVDNFYIACLECNLKRRRRSDDKFFFTKQMKLIKVPEKGTSLDSTSLDSTSLDSTSLDSTSLDSTSL